MRVENFRHKLGSVYEMKDIDASRHYLDQKLSKIYLLARNI